MNDDHFDALPFAQGEDGFRTEAQQSVLVCWRQPPDAFPPVLQPALAMVDATARVGWNLHAPALGGSMGLEDPDPAVQVGLLPAAGHAGTTHSGFRLIAGSQECGPGVVPPVSPSFRRPN